MAVKILCALITVTLLFGEIRANVEPRSSSSEKYVPMSAVYPSSSNPALPSVPSSPATQFNPDVPNSHDAPLPPTTTPSLTNSPSLPGGEGSPIRQPPRYPLPYYPHRATPQYFSSPVNSAPTPGQLSYDYASGNRKLLNKVHIPLKRNPTQPQPAGALPLNNDSSDNVPTFQQQPLPSNPNIVPLAALPLNDQSNTGNKNSIKPEDLTSESVRASPIPVKPNDSNDSDNSKNTITFNPKDIPYQPVSNIEASPIPIRPVGAMPLNSDGSDNVPTFQQKPLPSNPNIVPLGALPLNDQSNNENTNTIKSEDLTPDPVDTIGASPIPVKPNDSSDSDNSKNTITFNPKDIPYQPVSSIEASPIPVRPEVNGSDNNEDLSPLPSDAIVGSSIPNQSEYINNEDATGNENTQTINPSDLTPEPTDTIAGSPIPVRSKNKQPPSLEASNITELQALPIRPKVNGSENNEDLSLFPSKAALGTSTPNKPNDTSGSDDSKNTITFNPKDIPHQPVSNIEASPIPIRPKVNSSEKNEDLSPLPSDDAVGPSTSNQPENNNDANASDNENTLTINPDDLTPEPTDTLAASPIPVKSKNNQPPSLEASDITKPQARNDESEEITQEGNDESSNDQNEVPENNEEHEDPLKDSVLNGTPSSDRDANFNPLGNVILNGTSSRHIPGENPLKNQIFNEPSIRDEETESESSGVENSGPSQKSTETESREANQKYSGDGDGI